MNEWIWLLYALCLCSLKWHILPTPNCPFMGIRQDHHLFQNTSHHNHTRSQDDALFLHHYLNEWMNEWMNEWIWLLYVSRFCCVYVNEWMNELIWLLYVSRFCCVYLNEWMNEWINESACCMLLLLDMTQVNLWEWEWGRMCWGQQWKCAEIADQCWWMMICVYRCWRLSVPASGLRCKDRHL